MSENNGKTHFPPRRVARNVSHVAHDIVTLAELQTELLKVDSGQFLDKAAKPILLLGLAAVVALGVVPVALIALAYGVTQAGVPLWIAFIISTVCGLLIAAAAGVWGWMQFRQSFKAFVSSREELKSNIAHLKWLLKGTPSGPSRISAH